MQVIVFTGGGTGGHVYPGLAVLDFLKRNTDYRLVWIGSQNGLEKSVVEAHGVEYFGVPSGKLRRYLSWKNITDLFRIFAGYFASRKLLRQLSPVALFSKGGFVSVPPVHAAHSLKIPVISHESDFDPGLATRLNLKASRFVCVPYPESRDYFPHWAKERLVVTGNPVRSGFELGDTHWIRSTWNVPSDIPVLLVLGGSLGAVQLNELVKSRLRNWENRVFVVHQTGKEWTPPADDRWYVSRPYFTSEMPHLYAGADLILSRAGAGTLWEAAIVQTPLFLVPLEVGSRGDQVRNALLFARRGAAEVWRVEDGEAAFDARFESLLSSKEKRNALKSALASFPAQESVRKISDLILSVVSSKG